MREHWTSDELWNRLESLNLAIANKFVTLGEFMSFGKLIGKTQLMPLKSLYRETGCEIYGKCEFMNPGGSVKDRAALYLLNEVDELVKERNLRPEDVTVVEGSAGNTAIALLHLCRSKGYKSVMFMPNTQSEEKIQLLRILGASVFPVPPKPFSDPQNYNHLASKYASDNPNHFWTNQFDNTLNRDAHYASTGPEILKDCIRFKAIKKPAVLLHQGTPEFYDGNFTPKPYEIKEGPIPLSAFVCATGSGGTLSGTAKFLKENSPSTRIILADPPGAVLFNAVKSGMKNCTPVGNGSITEGIGQGRITCNLKDEFHLIDDAVHITDEETIRMVFKMLDEEGLLIGASTALNIVAAVKVAKMMGPESRIVTIICDSGHKYQSRLFSRKWLESKNLYRSLPEKYKSYCILE
eukprot:NODE_917_length_3095_cov_0.664219.p1 type:complete len:408 gc:universal NODE_917_length_3095_cov_0.664219:1380-157(-)